MIYPALYVALLRANQRTVGLLDHLTYTWISRTTTPTHLVNSVNIIESQSLSHFPILFYQPLLAFISQAFCQLTRH